MKFLRIPRHHNENHENSLSSRQNNENHKIPIIKRQKKENHWNLIIPRQSLENHEIYNISQHKKNENHYVL